MSLSRLSHRKVAVLATALAGFCAFASAHAVQLITEEEARLPAAPKIATRGGITRGPSISVVSPDPRSQIRPPFAMTVQFRAHGGSAIDPTSVKVTYLKKPAVDLTSRLKPAISASGIAMEGIDVPAGTHDIRIDVTDADGRTKSEIVTFTAVK